MSSIQMPSEITISSANCCVLASEVWRLRRHADSLGETDAVSLRYSIRQLSRLLDDLNVQIVDLAGRPYDPGMIQEVVEVIDDPEMFAGRRVIAETILPTITWNGAIAQPGKISLRRSPFLASESSEVSS